MRRFICRHCQHAFLVFGKTAKGQFFWDLIRCRTCGGYHCPNCGHHLEQTEPFSKEIDTKEVI